MTAHRRMAAEAIGTARVVAAVIGSGVIDVAGFLVAQAAGTGAGVLVFSWLVPLRDAAAPSRV